VGDREYGEGVGGSNYLIVNVESRYTDTEMAEACNFFKSISITHMSRTPNLFVDATHQPTYR
jgi:hypothetical protein